MPHGQNTVQSLAHITFRVQTLICTAPDCVVTAILITKAPGLVWLCPVPTQHTQTLPSHPTLEQGGCSYFSSIHHMPNALHAHVRHIPGRYKSPLPLSSGGGVGVTICHFTRQYLFAPSLNLSAKVSLTCRPIFALWTWAMSSDKYWVNHMSGMSGQPQIWLHCLKSEPLPLLPTHRKHTHTQSSTPLVVCQWSRQAVG